MYFLFNHVFDLDVNLNVVFEAIRFTCNLEMISFMVLKGVFLRKLLIAQIHVFLLVSFFRGR